MCFSKTLYSFHIWWVGDFGLLDMFSDGKLNNSTLLRLFRCENESVLYYHGVPEKTGWVQPLKTRLFGEIELRKFWVGDDIGQIYKMLIFGKSWEWLGL